MADGDPTNPGQGARLGAVGGPTSRQAAEHAATQIGQMPGQPPLAGMPGPGPGFTGGNFPGQPANQNPPMGGTRGNVGMSFVLDVPVELTIELGRKNMKIAEVLRLGPGSVLELDKVSGEPLDIYVNNRLIARGEAVVIGERYGVRLTEVLVSELEEAS